MNSLKEHRIVAAFAALLLGLCIVGIAAAATVTVSWVPPTTNTDSSAIPATGVGSLTTYRVEYGTCNGTAFGVKAGEVTRAAPATGTTLNLQPGTTCVRAFVANTYGKESAASNVSSKVVDAPTPNPPQLTTIDTVAYEVRPNEQTFGFDRGRQVGTIKVGAACDEDRKTDDNADLYALERPSRVKLTRTPISKALVAKCGGAQVSRVTQAQAGSEGQLHLDDGDRMLVGTSDHQAAQ